MKYDWSNPQHQAEVKALYEKACTAESPKPVAKPVADTDEDLEGYWPKDEELNALIHAAFHAGVPNEEYVSLSTRTFKDEAEFYRLLSRYQTAAAEGERKYRPEDHQSQLLFFCVYAFIAGIFVGLGWYLSR
jgi:hypothetical protein